MSSEAKYRANTNKYMVTERGRMPYDSRLFEDTRVPDDYVPKKEKIQFVEIYEMPNNTELSTYELDRLDHEWQKKWFRENGDLNIRIKKRKGDGSDDKTILSQIQKYRNDLGEFHRNDETYKIAHEEFKRKNKERNELSNKRNDIRKSLEKNTLRSISVDDANKLGWILENDPKYTIHTSSKHNTKYVYPNEFREKWTGEKVVLNDNPIWLGETIVDEKNDKIGGKKRKSRKMKKTKKRTKVSELVSNANDSSNQYTKNKLIIIYFLFSMMNVCYFYMGQTNSDTIISMG